MASHRIIHKRFGIQYNADDEEDFKNNVQNQDEVLKVSRSQNDDDEAVPEYALTDFIKNFDFLTINIKPLIPLPMVIPPCPQYENLQKGSIISLIICKVYSPLLFFFHIHEEDNELLKMEEEMEHYYNFLLSRKLDIPYHYITVGEIYAARVGNNWHRVKVLSLPQYLGAYRKVEVLLIDYGIIFKVPMRDLKLLAQSFFKIPIQAVRGRLALFELTQKIISTESTKYFEFLVHDPYLSAYVTEVDKDKSSLSLILVNKEVEPKCDINKALMEQGFAGKQKFMLS